MPGWERPMGCWPCSARWSSTSWSPMSSAPPAPCPPDPGGFSLYTTYPYIVGARRALPTALTTSGCLQCAPAHDLWTDTNLRSRHPQVCFQEVGQRPVDLAPVHPVDNLDALTIHRQEFKADRPAPESVGDLLRLAQGNVGIIRAVRDDQRDRDVVGLVDRRHAFQKGPVARQAAV